MPMKPIRTASNPVTLSVRKSETTRSLSVGQLLPAGWRLVQCYTEVLTNETVRIVIRNVATPEDVPPAS